MQKFQQQWHRRMIKDSITPKELSRLVDSLKQRPRKELTLARPPWPGARKMLL
jgi:hypothetical protein